MKSKRKILILVSVLVLVVVVFFATMMGFYTIQPIGAIPDGATLLVWRASGEPFFNSPDAVSLKVTGGVSLMSRAMALSQAPKDRIILRLPYWNFAYMRSTGGIRFDK